MKLLSFRLKIALLSAGISGLVLLGFGIGSWYLLYRHRVEAVDTEIRALGTRHPGWLANRANFARFNASLEFIFGEEHKGKAILLVKDAHGETLYTSPGWPKTLVPESIDCTLAADSQAGALVNSNSPAAPAAGPPWNPGVGAGRAGRGFGPGQGAGPIVFNKQPRFLTRATPESTWRLGILGNDDLRLVVGLNYETVQADLNRLRNAFVLTVPFALILVGGGGWWVAGRALRPLRTISRTAEQVTARGLHQRIPPSNEDPEIRRLILVLNGMMDRLEASFRQATRFSADASHELKTPLAIMQGELEQAIVSTSPGSDEQRVFNNLLEETQQLKRITSSLLLLAQADSGQLPLTPEALSLSEELQILVEDAQVLAAEQNIRLELALPPGIQVRGDRGLLRMALINLLTNAFRYNEPGGCVSLVLTPDAEVAVTICNTGPGIPPEDQPQVFNRFYRGKSSATRSADGLGLGLSLAREIILAHQGRLELTESRPGRTCFTLTLPPLNRRVPLP